MSWENDDRGKPSKWVRTILVDNCEFLEDRVLPENRQIELQQAMSDCRAALVALGTSGEHYSVRVQPELVWEDDLESLQRRFMTRCRVRWCADEQTLNIYQELGFITAAEFARGNALVEKAETARLTDALQNPI